MRLRALHAGIALTTLALASCASGHHTATSASTTTSPDAPASPTSAAKGATGAATAQTAQWWTYDGDSSRPGRAPDGPQTGTSVRRLWQSPGLDGDVYAQPLIVGDRIYIATENNTVYALRANDGGIVWQANLGKPVSGSSLPCGNVDPVGITGTPVVDRNAGRLYAVGMLQPHRHVLFALDIATGKQVAQKDVDAPGSDARVQNQRAALSLSRGTIFVPFGGRFGDCGDYHGRITSVASTATGFGATTSYTLPTQREGGFWTPPGAVIAGDGSLFITSGNSSSSGTYDYGNSVVHLTPALDLVDAWAPKNWKALNASDGDVNSTGAVLVGGNRIFQIGKQGLGYLLDATHLGGIGGELHSTQVCNGSGAYGAVAQDNGTLFVPCTNGVVQVHVTSDALSRGWAASMTSPGPTVVSNGIVWTINSKAGDLVALDEATGRTLGTQHLGDVPSRFTSPGLGNGEIVAAANRTVYAFGR